MRVGRRERSISREGWSSRRGESQWILFNLGFFSTGGLFCRLSVFRVLDFFYQGFIMGLRFGFIGNLVEGKSWFLNHRILCYSPSQRD
jgi:hypothetical protein